MNNNKCFAISVHCKITEYGSICNFDKLLTTQPSDWDQPSAQIIEEIFPK